MALKAEGVQQLAVAIVCLSVSVLAVVIRFWCKFALKNGIHGDDWWILISLITYSAGLSAEIWGIFTGGKGLNLEQITAELEQAPSLPILHELENYLESLFLSVTFTFFVLYTCKMSILFLYRRIFSTRPYRVASVILMALTSSWFVAAIITDLVVCIPVDHFWHRQNPGRCFNFDLFFIIITIIEICLDAATLTLPVLGILSLQMSTRTRTLILAIFLVGCFSIITNILRLYYSYQPNAEYVDFRKSTLWTNIHIMVTILCACLPVYKPIRAIGGNLFSSLRQRYGSSWQSFFARSKSNITTYQQDDLALTDYKNHQSGVRLALEPDRAGSTFVVISQGQGRADTTVPPCSISRVTKIDRSVEIV